MLLRTLFLFTLLLFTLFRPQRIHKHRGDLAGADPGGRGGSRKLRDLPGRGRVGIKNTFPWLRLRAIF